MIRFTNSKQRLNGYKKDSSSKSRGGHIYD